MEFMAELGVIQAWHPFSSCKWRACRDSGMDSRFSVSILLVLGFQLQPQQILSHYRRDTCQKLDKKMSFT